jgi:hypothetical protein
VILSNFSYGNAQNISGSATVLGAPAPANDWRFAEGYIGGQFMEMFLMCYSNDIFHSGDYATGSKILPVALY